MFLVFNHNFLIQRSQFLKDDHLGNDTPEKKLFTFVISEKKAIG